MKYKPLIIGDLIASAPIIQGGMGVGISLSGLASAVASCGGIGVISAAQPGFREPDFYTNTIEANMRALAREIKTAKTKSNNGIIGVNIMVALNDFDNYVKCCMENNADLIISGAGLPMKLPELTKGHNIKIAPIVSSLKAAKVILQRWDKRYSRSADLIVIEGPMAGGHLGFHAEDAERLEHIDDEVKAILEYKKIYEEKYGKSIPVVFGGGVFSSSDVNHYINEIGTDGVQVATRFVATKECDADEAFKMAYINSTKETIGLVKSPVGMPGRAILNSYIKKTALCRDPVSKCFNCIHTCNPATTPYCLSKALFNAANGDLENALIFCGKNAYKIKEITTVKEVMDDLLS